MSDMVVNQEDFLARRLVNFLYCTLFFFMLAKIVVCMHI